MMFAIITIAIITDEFEKYTNMSYYDVHNKIWMSVKL